MASIEELEATLNLAYPSTPTPPSTPSNTTDDNMAGYEARLNQAYPTTPEPELPEGDALSSIIEPVRAIASGMKNTVLGGLAGMAVSQNPWTPPGSGARTVKALQSQAYQPETQAGVDSMKAIGGAVDWVTEQIRPNLGTMAGLFEVAAGNSAEQGFATRDRVREVGLGPALGERTLDATGSPLLATAAHIAPEATVELLGMKGFGPAVRGSKATAKATQELASGLSKFQGPAKRRAAKLIDAGSSDVDTAAYRITRPGTKPNPDSSLPKALQDALDVNGSKVGKDPLAAETIKQGFDPGVIADVKISSPETKVKLGEMVTIMEKVQKNKAYGLTHRPSDVAGGSLKERLDIVIKTNKEAADQLDSVADSLKGSQVNFDAPVQSFISDITEMGIKINKDMSLDFKGSILEGAEGPQRILSLMTERMANTQVPDAFDLHRLKRLIDFQVSYGKKTEGLTGKAELSVKKLRHNIDEVLDTNFPEYNAVNTKYSDTVGIIKEMQSIAGPSVNLDGPYTKNAFGTMLRRVMGNSVTRSRLLESLDVLEDTVSKYMVKPTGKDLAVLGDKPYSMMDNLKSQILFADELDVVFGSVPRTSLTGDVGKAVKGAANARNANGAFEIGINLAADGIEKSRGINPDNAFKSIKELLDTTQ